MVQAIPLVCLRNGFKRLPRHLVYYLIISCNFNFGLGIIENLLGEYMVTIDIGSTGSLTVKALLKIVL